MDIAKARSRIAAKAGDRPSAPIDADAVKAARRMAYAERAARPISPDSVRDLRATVAAKARREG